MKTNQTIPSHHYKAVIFDLDGTLIDSLQDLTDACNAMLSVYDLPPKTYEEGKGLIGRGLRNLVKRALPEAMRDDATVDAAHEIMQAEYQKRYTAKTLPYAGIPELLETLKSWQIPFAINTNKPDNAAKIITRALLPFEDFTDVIGQREDRPRKPDPAMALALAKQMGVNPDQCIYCGDSVVDYETAVNAGMLPLICTWGFTAPSVLRELPKAVCIDSATEGLAVLESALEHM